MTPVPALRILMLSAHYPPALNGYAIQCRDTAELLAARGHEVRVLTSTPAPPQERLRAVRVPELRAAPAERSPSLHPRWLAAQLKRRATYGANARVAVEVANEFRPDVALVWQFDTVGIALVSALQRVGVPLAFNVGDSSLGTLIPLLRRRSHSPVARARAWLHNANVDALDLSHLMVVSSELLRWYRDQGFPEATMQVVHNGIPSSWIAPVPPPLRLGTRLLFVGRLHPTKGVSLALEAIAIANRSKPTLSLDIVGTGDANDVRELEELVERLELAAYVRFVGPKNRDSVLALYPGYDVLLFPSTYIEPFGLTVVEAMSQGLPVIALDRGGPRDIITHMGDGLLVSNAVPEAYAAAIRQLADSPALRTQLANAAIATVADRFTLEQHVERTEALLHEVAVTSRDDRRAHGWEPSS